MPIVGVSTNAVRIRIEFGAHVKQDLVLGHLADWGCEVVPSGESDRIFTIVVFRRPDAIKHELAIWERKGDLTWSDEAKESN